MRTRILIIALALVATACASGATGTTTTAPPATTAAPTTTSAPTATALAGRPAIYAYSYKPGDTYSYDISLDQHITLDMTVEGDPGMFETQDGPTNVDVRTSVAGSLSYDIAEGPEPDTTALHISGVFDEFTVEGTIDGEPVSNQDLESGTVPDLVEVPDTTIILDRHGRPISVDGEPLPTDLPFFGDPFSMVGGLTSGGLDKPFGPEFPDRPLAIGDTWTKEQSEDIPSTDQTVASTVTYTVTGYDTIDGYDVAVIDFTSQASGVDIDLGKMFQALFEGFSSMSEEGSTTEIPTIDFVISVGDSTGSGTYWFDQEAGLVRQVEQTYTVPILMHMAVESPEGSGTTDMEMTVESTVRASLQPPGTPG
ncbi:MAG TPA: hypothetical protein ENH33_06600 [Actinobacteria bacterium]|nr:hypothetical protein [Actinomycetota bacterium]